MKRIRQIFASGLYVFLIMLAPRFANAAIQQPESAEDPQATIRAAENYIFQQCPNWSLEFKGTHYTVTHFLSGTYEWWEGEVADVSSVRDDGTSVFINGYSQRSFAGAEDPNPCYASCSGIKIDDIRDSSASPHIANAFRQAFVAAKHLGDSRHSGDPF